MTSTEAVVIVEALRKGTPPQRGVEAYAVGNEKLVEGIQRHHLAGISDRGLIRFVSGSWGAGKTHFFRVLRELAFGRNCLVSNVELDVNEAPLNKFERVFHAIVRSIQSPRQYRAGGIPDAEPFAEVLQEALGFLAHGNHELPSDLTFEVISTAKSKLAADNSIDIDFKRLVERYWDTYLPEGGDTAALATIRGDLMQWFAGEGTVGHYRKEFGINKMVARENAKLMLRSLAGFVRLVGYNGLLILFDEAEQSYSLMRKTQLRDAQNNLLSLINGIEDLPGLFLIYATTPDFFTDPRHGIVVYGALAGRIGTPEDRPPRALDKIWNLDAVQQSLADYQLASRKIRDIYTHAYADSSGKMPADERLDELVKVLFENHPSMSGVRFWRVLVTAIILNLDDHMEGDVRAPSKVYVDVMDRLRDA